MTNGLDATLPPQSGDRHRQGALQAGAEGGGGGGGGGAVEGLWASVSAACSERSDADAKGRQPVRSVIAVAESLKSSSQPHSSQPSLMQTFQRATPQVRSCMRPTGWI